MAYLKFKDEHNQWQDLPAIRGVPGRDGAIQYQAGNNITIVDNVISAVVEGISFAVVQELPVTGEPNIIYLVPSSNPGTQNATDEYVYINNDWELIGTTSIDLSAYYTSSQVDAITGSLTNLDTTIKTSLVAAINELVTNGGVRTLQDPVIQLGTGNTGTKYDPGVYIVKGHSSCVYYNNVLRYTPFPNDNLIGIALIVAVDASSRNLFFFSYDYSLSTMAINCVNGSGRYEIIANTVAQTNRNQTFSMQQTFSNPPECTQTPTDDADLTNKAYVDSVVPIIYSGTTDPSSSLGEDGDIYVKYTN